MIYLPPLRRFLLPAFLILLIILFYRSTSSLHTNLSSYVVRQPVLGPLGTRILLNETETREVIIHQSAQNYLSPPTHLYYEYDERPESMSDAGPSWRNPSRNTYMQELYKCPVEANKFTKHIRLKNPMRNVSMTYKGDTDNEKLSFLNPAILSLPYWSKNQYLVVSRVQTDGSHQQNLLCEANICHIDEGEGLREGEHACTADDIKAIGPGGGMRCATTPITLNVPPTPAKTCGEGTGILMDIPGFHDPRIFWTGRGEPVMMVNSQSRYACFGLWAIDLRKLHPPLQSLLEAEPNGTSLGPLMSYPSLTELTRNPADTRGPIEKNWMFFSSPQSSFIHYDIAPGRRTFAKLLGGGLTTVNLTDPMEQSCIKAVKNQKKVGSWHQSTNSLRLILCDRADAACAANVENTVFFAMIHHKIKGPFGLPIRYERYFMVWSAAPPFSMLGMSQHAVLFANETATGWSEEENWADDEDNRRRLATGKKGKPMFATFTYTVSLAYAWGRANDGSRDKNVGYLDDEVVVGVGIDDGAMMYARVPARSLLQCLRACPGRAASVLEKADGIKSVEEKAAETKEKLADVINVGAAAAAVDAVVKSGDESAAAAAAATIVESSVASETANTHSTSAASASASTSTSALGTASSSSSAATATAVAEEDEQKRRIPPTHPSSSLPGSTTISISISTSTSATATPTTTTTTISTPLKEEGAAPPPLPHKTSPSSSTTSKDTTPDNDDTVVLLPPNADADAKIGGGGEFVEAALSTGDRKAVLATEAGGGAAETAVEAGAEVGANPPRLGEEEKERKGAAEEALKAKVEAERERDRGGLEGP